MDPRTFVLVSSTIGCAIGACLLLAWVVSRRDVPGLGSWVLGAGGITLGLLLAALGGRVPALVSIELANVFFIGGHAAVAHGHGLFTGRRLPAWVVIGPPVIALLGIAYFHLVVPNYWVRILFAALATGSALLLVAWLLLKNAKGVERLPSLVCSALAALCAMQHVGRLVNATRQPAEATVLTESWAPLTVFALVVSATTVAFGTMHLLLIGTRLLHRTRTLVGELETALASIRTLKGLLSQCAWCRRLKEEDGTWSELSRFVSNNTDALVSHGVCPECEEKVLRAS